MRKVYVAHPYGGKEENKESVEEIIRGLVRSEEEKNTVYLSPIHALGFLYDDVTYEKGMEYCLELLGDCNELFLCPGWEQSRGCNMEFDYSLKHNKVINVTLVDYVLDNVIESREPRGRFYAYDKDTGMYIGVDNSTGNAWVGEFGTKEYCLFWLAGRSQRR